MILADSLDPIVERFLRRVKSLCHSSATSNTGIAERCILSALTGLTIYKVRPHYKVTSQRIAGRTRVTRIGRQILYCPRRQRQSRRVRPVVVRRRRVHLFIRVARPVWLEHEPRLASKLALTPALQKDVPLAGEMLV
jgi:hypothetical protein